MKRSDFRAIISLHFALSRSKIASSMILNPFSSPEPKFADFAAKAAPLFRDNLFGKLRTCIHQCAWKAKDLRSRRTQNNQRLMIASAGISDQLAAGLVGLMWQSSAAILERRVHNSRSGI
ncbi:unnamed protein product [Oikopleura dioica]|uniref:Uncharacterized protein n=1 Tax=Oikopleura dioica TaxID=34765 RepID=E4XY68_OIKDI|nr:unnamed protein product [Oikopleura dioica]